MVSDHTRFLESALKEQSKEERSSSSRNDRDSTLLVARVPR